MLGDQFQFTGPLRDPTGGLRSDGGRDTISIHRSLAGPDEKNGKRHTKSTDFNPQVPCGTRRDHECVRSIHMIISIHRSLAGPDVIVGVVVPDGGISIHRSLAGPDLFLIFPPTI